MITTLNAAALPPNGLPIWARLQLATLGIPFAEVRHFAQEPNGHLGVATGDRLVHLTKNLT